MNFFFSGSWGFRTKEEEDGVCVSDACNGTAFDIPSSSLGNLFLCGMAIEHFFTVVCLASLAAYVARDGAFVAVWPSFRLRQLSIADFAYANMGDSQIRISGRYPTWGFVPCLTEGSIFVCKLRDKSSLA